LLQPLLILILILVLLLLLVSLVSRDSLRQGEWSGEAGVRFGMDGVADLVFGLARAVTAGLGGV
jgi:hypothetical protein